jgi:circadian clock protein KaiC
MAEKIEEGSVEIIWHPALENDPDALVEELLAAVRRRNVKRLFIDGLEPFRDALVYPERGPLLFNALMNELRALGVTSLFSAELPDLFSARIFVPIDSVSAIIDNIIFLRYVELHSQLYRLISILKMRESDYDPAIREFKISSGGIEVASTFESAEAILTGVARPLPAVQPQHIPAGGATSITGEPFRS